MQGLCCGTQGYNLPHVWQAGWGPVMQLNSTVLAAGTTVQLTLTALELSSSVGVRIVAADWPSGQDPIYIAYRLQASAEGAEYANKTNIHTSSIMNSTDTVLQGTLTDGEAWISAANGVVVRQLSSTDTQVRGCAPSGRHGGASG